MIDNQTKRKRLQKWCVALRSGEYKQGFREFHSANGSKCCLGVAETIIFGDEQSLYQRLEDYLGLKYHSDIRVLEEMNDSGEHLFNQIADYIEQNLMPEGD